jgi:hypothetical protein
LEAAVLTRKQIVTVILAAGLMAGCSSQPDTMDSYVTSDADGAMMVQFTSVRDGHVSGIVSLVAANKDGKNLAGTRSFSGTIEGKALNLSIENGTGVTMATGTLEGDTLRLTLFGNGNSTRFVLAKSEAEKFNEAANASRVRAAEKRQETESAAALSDRMEQRSKTQRSIDQLADSVFAKAGEVAEKSRKLDVVIAGYQTAKDRTGRMQSAMHNIDAASPEGSYRISQIEYQIDGLASGVENTHSEVQSYMRSLSGFVNDGTLKSSQLQAECQADRLLDCSRLSASMQSLQARYQQFQRDFERENAAFRRQRGGGNLAIR